MKRILVLSAVLIVSACALTGCEESEQVPQKKYNPYVDIDGNPFPVEKQLVYAAQGGDLAHLKTLHEQGASLSGDPEQGKAPFEAATRNRQAHVLQYLLDNGIDPNTSWGSGAFKENALTETVEAGWFEGVKLLVAKGADVSGQADDDDEYAVPLYCRALDAGHIGIAQFLVDNGADPSWRRADGYNALFAVIDDDPPGGGPVPSTLEVKENLPGLRLAVENGADIHARYRNITPLIMAAVYGKKETYEYLVAQGASPDKKDAYGNTPAEYYTRAKFHPKGFRTFYKERALAQMITPDVPLETIQALVNEEYAQVDAVYSKEYTPLIFAAVYQRKDIYDFLVAGGADVNWTDEHGNRAEQYLTGEKKHPGSLFAAYYAERSKAGGAPEKKRSGNPLDYRLSVSYSGHPIKIYINGTLAESSPKGWSAFTALFCKEYLKKGVNTVRVTWGAMPGEPGWDAATARYTDPAYVRVGFQARYDKDGNDTEAVFAKDLSLFDAVTLAGGRVPAYEFTFYSDVAGPLNSIVAQAAVCNSTPEEADANIALMRKFAREIHSDFTAGRILRLVEKSGVRLENGALSSGSPVGELTAEYKNTLENIRRQGLGYTLQSDEQIVLLPTFGGRLWTVGVMRSAEAGNALTESAKMQPEFAGKADYHLFQSTSEGGLSTLLPITIAKMNGRFVIVR